MTTIPLINAVIMASNEFAKRMIGVKENEETLSETLTCGIFTGLVGSFIYCPVELIKCKL